MTSDLIATLLRMFREALSRPELGPFESFFTAGGDSLTAVTVLVRVDEELGVRLVYRDFLEAPTPAKLALRIVREAARQHDRGLAAEIAALSADDARVLLAQLKADRSS